MPQVSLSAYCEKNNITEDEVRAKIKNKELVGRPKMGIWYIDVDDATGIALSDIHKDPDATSRHNQTPKRLIKLSTLDYVSGAKIKEIDLVSASTVQSVNILKSMGSEMRTQTFGGKSNTLSNAMEDAREELLRDIQTKSYALKADAVIGIRFATSEVLERAIELMVYGTAVKIIEDD